MIEELKNKVAEIKKKEQLLDIKNQVVSILKPTFEIAQESIKESVALNGIEIVKQVANEINESIKDKSGFDEIKQKLDKQIKIMEDESDKNIVIEEKEFLIKTALITAIQYADQDLRPSAEQQVRAYIIGTQIMTKDEVEFTSEDIVYIKERLLRCYTAMIYGQVVQILEGTDKEAKKENPVEAPKE